MEENGRGTITDAAELARRHDVDFVPTTPEDTDLRRVRRARNCRRLFMLALFVFLGVGLTGRLGVLTHTTTARSGGYELTVTYGHVTRGGLATPWSFEVHRPGGFVGPITISSTSAYFELFDQNGFDPEPSSSTATPDSAIWQFEAPEGDTLSVSLDARLEPGVQWGRPGETSVLVDGEPVVTAKYKTWVLP